MSDPSEGPSEGQLEAQSEELPPISAALGAALAELPPELRAFPKGAEAGFLRLFDLLEQWKGAGLVGFGTPEALARHYFAEALALRPFLPEAGACLDVGSGGGTPALPLALALPETSWTLLEPRKTAAGFLGVAVEALGLASRVRVLRRRLKDYLNDASERDALEALDAVTLRAVRLSAKEWSGLARGLAPEATVIWPTSEAGRARADLPSSLFDEQTTPAERGFVWVGRPLRDPGHVSRETSPEPAPVVPC